MTDYIKFGTIVLGALLFAAFQLGDLEAARAGKIAQAPLPPAVQGAQAGSAVY